MLRKSVRVLAMLFLTGSLVAGCIATITRLTPSDEQRLYEEKYREAIEKLRQAEAARGTPVEARLAKEARDAAESANLWGRGYRARLQASRLSMLASGGVALLCLIILLLTFIKRKDKQIGVAPGPWSHSPHSNYGQPGLDRRPPQAW